MRTFAQKQNQLQRPVSSSLARSNMGTIGPDHREHPILHLQRTIGNQVVLRILQTHAEEPDVGLTAAASHRFGYDFSQIPLHPPVAGAIQTKLATNKPVDEYEQEADRISAHVMRMPELQLQCASTCGGAYPKCQTEQPGHGHERLHTKHVESGNWGQTEVPPIIHEVLRSPGQPLDPPTRALMEPRFGHNFANVRVHLDRRAARSANAIGALAYTCGESIVFGAGQHRPDTKVGRHLLAHELAHVVQQAQRPSSLIRRQPSKDDEDKKRKRIAHHERQQKLVAGFLADALKIKPKPAKGVLDPDNLFHNTAQLVDPPKTAKASLKVLTPTHYSTHDAPVYFDVQIAYPQIGGDYPADPAKRVTADVSGSSLITARPDVGGQTGFQPQPQATGVSTSSKGEERAPERVPYKQPSDPKREPSRAKTVPPSVAAPAATFSPAEIKLFIGNGDGTSTADITLDEFKKNLVHEGQHVSDWSLGKTDPVEWKRVLERYKSEFRAFSIQPPQSAFGKPTPIGSSTVRPSISLTAGEKCGACGGTASAPATQPTAMKNERQERIFLNLITNYPHEKFSCFYVCNQDFRDAVTAYDTPSSMNLVNSTRLIDVSIAVQKLTPGMTGVEIGKTDLQSTLEQMDPIDWAFLKDEKLSDPFWVSVKNSAPAPAFEALKALAKKGTPSAKDISKGLKNALAKLKAE